MKSWQWKTAAIDATLNASEWHLIDGSGRNRCTIWKARHEHRFTWHTWNERGIGGENDEAGSLNDAKDQAVAAIVRQGWAPGGWRVSW